MDARADFPRRRALLLRESSPAKLAGGGSFEDWFHVLDAEKQEQAAAAGVCYIHEGGAGVL